MNLACGATHPDGRRFCYLPEGHADAHEARITDWARACWARWVVAG